jgi:hypothetical protein
MAGLLSALLLSVGLGSVTAPPPALPTISAPAVPSSLAESVAARASTPVASVADPPIPAGDNRSAGAQFGKQIRGVRDGARIKITTKDD